MGHSSLAVSLTYLRGLEVSEIYSSTTNPPSDKTISNYINLLIKQGKIIRVSQGKYKKRL